ncbi:transposable element Tc1 transposase [Trichonephila clavipes]|nr:transposable element Tc1 transposase [Trichonephila clavipes]
MTRRIQAHYEQLSEYERRSIIELKEADLNHAVRGPIVFSNESRLQLCPDDHRGRVWRSPGQPADPVLTNGRPTGPQPALIVSGAISFDCRTSLVFISLYLVTYSTAVRRRDSENYFATIPLAALWPARSPDISPIKHV